MEDNFQICRECGNQRPVNTPGCPTCDTQEAEAAGHSGWFDLCNGWTCNRECPACNPTGCGDGWPGNHEFAEIECPKCGRENQCWGCSVRCTDDSTGAGEFTCRSCGHNEHFPFEDKPCREWTCPHRKNFPVVGECKPDFDTPVWRDWLDRRNSGELVGRAPGSCCPFWLDSPSF